MQPDEYGFLYPQIDEARCVGCGLCERVCAYQHGPKRASEKETYAAAAQDADLQQSASGGLFASLAQAVLARGDRRMGDFLLEAHASGQSLKYVLKQAGLDMEELAEQELCVAAPLPWQHLDMGVTVDYLKKELQRSEQGQFTPMCFDKCVRCGVCRAK